MLTVGLPLRASCGCCSWSYLCYLLAAATVLALLGITVLRTIDFGKGAVFVLYDELRMNVVSVDSLRKHLYNVQNKYLVLDLSVL